MRRSSASRSQRGRVLAQVECSREGYQGQLLAIEVAVEIHRLLVHRPGGGSVLEHGGVVEAHGVVHAALPSRGLERSVGRTVLAQAVPVVIARRVPEGVVSDELRIELAHERDVARSIQNLFDRPARERRLGVAPVVLARVEIDDVRDHARIVLVVEHRAHLVLRDVGVETDEPDRVLPRVPGPETVEVVHVARGEERAVAHPPRGRTPVVDERLDRFRRQHAA